MKTEIERKLKEEADFGDLVELTLKSDKDYCARHEQGRVVISPRENGVDYQERDIIYVVGYYGGMRSGNFKETVEISEIGATPILISYPSETTTVCLDPTLHRKDALDTIKWQGKGLVRIPASAIASYRIMSKERRGLRVVN